MLYPLCCDLTGIVPQWAVTVSESWWLVFLDFHEMKGKIKVKIFEFCIECVEKSRACVYYYNRRKFHER